MKPRSGRPARIIQTWEAVAIVVGIVVGAGIFKTPSLVAGFTRDSGWMVAAWIGGALISFAGALCYAELSTAHPGPGGDYLFLSRAYGRNISFLYAWAKAGVINTGSIAMLSYVFGDYMTRVLSLGAQSSALWAVIIVILLTALNLLGIHASSRLQGSLVLVALLGLSLVVLAGFTGGGPQAVAPTVFALRPEPGSMGLAMVFVLLTFGGWSEAAFITAELKGGSRRIVAVLMISLTIITILYLLVNVSLVLALGVGGLAGSSAAAADVLGTFLGPSAERLMGLLVATTALTSINSTMVVGARTTIALGSHWPALKALSSWNSRQGAPMVSLLIQSALSLALIGFGALQASGFNAMVEFTAPLFWTFLFLVGLSLFILRSRRQPGHARAFRVPLYPITPVLFCAASLYLSYSSFAYAASRQAVHISVAVMLIGLVCMATLMALEARRSQPSKSPLL